jgi:hypothetical protein
MNGLLSKFFAFMVLFLGCFVQGNAGETIKMGFRLPTYPQADRDFAVVQNYLVCKAFSEVEAGEKEECTVSFDIEGELFIEGDQEKIHPLAGALGTALEKITTEEMSEEGFQKAMEGYLASFDASNGLQEKELASEIKWEDVLEVRDSLKPLAKMLCSISSAIADKPPLTLVSNNPNYQLFYQLPIDQSDQDHISRLIKKMADSGYWELLKKKKDMEKLGDKIQHVHPLRFIGYVYGHHSLKSRMPKIMDDRFKRRGFLNGHGGKEGFAQRMTKEAHHHNLMQFVPGFAQSVGVSEAAIESYFDRHDWEGLLRFLM